MYSQAYVHALQAGPFPGRMDPFAETGRYFHQIHTEMIAYIVARLQQPLLQMGYIVVAETSMQVLDGRQPDIAIQGGSAHFTKLDYVKAAQAANLDVGVEIEYDETTLMALYIYQEAAEKRLITVLEIISPANKNDSAEIAQYRERRRSMIREQLVNVVEIDAARSIKRMNDARLVRRYPYHTSIYLPGDSPRLLGCAFDHALSPFALPLHEQVVSVHPAAAYRAAYQVRAIASQIDSEQHYSFDAIPFPSLLTEEQRSDVMLRVHDWRAQLARLKDDG